MAVASQFGATPSNHPIPLRHVRHELARMGCYDETPRPDRIFTVWLVLVDIPEGKGGLVVAEGSHLLGSELDRGTPTKAGGDVPRSWAAEGDAGAWRKRGWKAGDWVIFSDDTVHAALKNLLQEFRTSMDARYYFCKKLV